MESWDPDPNNLVSEPSILRAMANKKGGTAASNARTTNFKRNLQSHRDEITAQTVALQVSVASIQGSVDEMQRSVEGIQRTVATFGAELIAEMRLLLLETRPKAPDPVGNVTLVVDPAPISLGSLPETVGGETLTRVAAAASTSVPTNQNQWVPPPQAVHVISSPSSPPPTPTVPDPQPTNPTHLHSKLLFNSRSVMAAKARVYKKTRTPPLDSGVGSYFIPQLHRKRRIWTVRASNGGFFPEMMKEICELDVGHNHPTRTSNPSSTPLISTVYEQKEVLHSMAASTLAGEIDQPHQPLLVTAATDGSCDDLSEVLISSSDDSCSHPDLSSQTHAHAAIVQIEMSDVVELHAQAVVDKHGFFSGEEDLGSDSLVEQQVTLTHEFYKQDFVQVYPHCTLGNFDKGRRALPVLIEICSDSLIIDNGAMSGNMGEGKLSAGEYYRKTEVLSVTVLDQIWHARLASEAVTLDTEIVLCSANAQSEPELRKLLVRCLQLCHCEAEKPISCHGKAFDKMVELFHTSLSQVSTTLNLSFQDIGGALENITSGMLELYRNCLNDEVGNVKWPPDELIEKMGQDVNQLIEEGLISTISGLGIVATLTACLHDKFLCLPITYSLEKISLFPVIMRKSRSIHAGYPLVLLWGSVIDPAIFWITNLTRGRMHRTRFLFDNERLLDSNYRYKPAIHKATVSTECLPKKTSAELSVVMGYQFQQSLIRPIIAKDVSADLRKQSGCMLTIQSLLNMFIDESSVFGEPSDQSDILYLFSYVQYLLRDCSGIDYGCSSSLFKRDIGKLHSQLVAGDVATPKLDILVTHVLNYDCPNDTHEFLHKTSCIDMVVSLTGESKKEIVNWLHDAANQPWYSRLRANWSKHSSVDSPVMFPLSVLEFSKPAVGTGMRYSYDHPIVLMHTVAVQLVVNPLSDAWLLLIHDHMCCSSRNTSLSMLPYFALGTTSRVFKYLSLMLVHMLKHKKATIDVIFPMAIFYVAYALTKVEVATSWILLSTPLFYLTVRVLHLHGWTVIKEYLLLEAAFLIIVTRLGNFLSILSEAIAIGLVCHFGETLQNTNSYLHRGLYIMCWLHIDVILETTCSLANFKVAFGSGLTILLPNINEDVYRTAAIDQLAILSTQIAWYEAVGAGVALSFTFGLVEFLQCVKPFDFART